MNGKELYRLGKKGTLRSVRDSGEIYEKSSKDQQWLLWTKLDATGIRRAKSIVDTMQADGWLVLG